MNKPFISYLVTCHNEGKQLNDLLNALKLYKLDNEIIILDDNSDDRDTLDVLCYYQVFLQASVHKHALNKNYGEHKNYGKSLCSGEYVFQIDGDELPNETLLQNLKEILTPNPTTELFWLPRVNVFKDVTEEHAKQWGWNIDNPNKWVNWHTGDYQSRIFKNLPHIKWEKRLHERVVGAKTFAILPKEEEYALYHNKTIEKQIETNLRYNKEFTENENRGV